MLDSNPGFIIGGFILGVGAACAALAFYGYLQMIIAGPC